MIATREVGLAVVTQETAFVPSFSRAVRFQGLELFLGGKTAEPRQTGSWPKLRTIAQKLAMSLYYAMLDSWPVESYALAGQ